ncbi:PREDICTED: conserved oligomeric Golgi complex subunit 2-like isoform X2 [Brassica oleracea var. oleracea]|uniref:conserved oligomeric Golgi complex subunit 2-like isoform X2 n=1 Tax=Brassica oleracea var. oleracea TaxID=109376 RepID=UPI0006A7286D|nr:PREDICTED: conserved oligomeric Golgi complex subunit 2-like isoform X2 [Brassica oleracea var. oleracea]
MSDSVASLPSPRSAADVFWDDSRPPLWFNPSPFLSPVFDSESFISDLLRTFVPFDTLRSELRSHVTSLNSELLDRINRDYADFVDLSTKLVDIDATATRMRAPLLELRDEINTFRGSVEAARVARASGLNERYDAAVAREVLESSLEAFRVVSKVEKLIQEQQDGASTRETQSMVLERIASELSRIKFYMDHAQNLPFIENLEKRTQSASVLFDASLRHCFVVGLNKRDSIVIYNCLRAYAASDNIKNAEEIFRATIVAPFMRKVIAHEAYDGTSGDELENDYRQIKLFIAKDCEMLLEISSNDKSGLHVFNFLANSILKEVLSAIQKVKPGVFSPGRPTEFLKNYKASLDFLAHLEGYYPSRSAVTKFRAEAICIEFMKQWNVGVYFSLRFQEIAGGLDSSLVFIQDSDSDKQSSPTLMLRQSVTLLESLRSCWKEDVLVFSAADKFLRLALQLLSRYCNWVSSAVNARKSNASLTPGCEWVVSATAEDFVYVIHDVNCIVSEVRGDYLGHISHYLSSCPSEVLDVVRKSILQGVESLQNVLPLVKKTIIEVIVDKSVEELSQLKGIAATCMMSNKPLPIRHSPYVVGLLRPLKAFLEGDKARHYLTHETREELLLGTLTEMTRRYYELAAGRLSDLKAG